MAQHPDYKNFVYKWIEYKFDNYQTPEITDALFILNGDTIQFVNGYGYAIPKESLSTKNSIQITHPKYKSLLLDSVRLDWHFPIYMFQEREEFYIENGIPTVLNFGRKYIAFKVSNNNYNPEEAKQYVSQICVKYKLKIGVSYQDSIKKINQLSGESTSQKAYGCLEPELEYIFWLEKEGDGMFTNLSSLYKNIRKNESIEWLGLPQDYHSYVLNGFEIEFKRGVDTMQISSLLKNYKLEISVNKNSSASGYTVYRFKEKQLIPSNDLMKDLMKESIVKYVRVQKMIYETCC
jgi:hypothetical protein